MAAAVANVSTSLLAGQALRPSSNAIDSIWCGADPRKFLGSFSGATSSYLTGAVKCWQLTMGRLSWSGNIYSYDQIKDSSYSQVKRSDITSLQIIHTKDHSRAMEIRKCIFGGSVTTANVDPGSIPAG
ncbi:unnamed protein product [Calypogeia fissa]